MASQEQLDHVAMESARLWSTLATCSRLSVGCVITDPRGRVVSSGYNGAPAGQPHCNHDCDCGHEGLDDMFHLGDCSITERCTTAIHSERNALQYADVSVEGFTMYCTHSPCMSCAGWILAHRVKRVVYLETYRKTKPLEVLSLAGVIVQRYEGGV